MPCPASKAKAWGNALRDVGWTLASIGDMRSARRSGQTPNDCLGERPNTRHGPPSAADTMGANGQEAALKPIHYFSVAGGALVPIALCFAGHAEAAGILVVLTLMIDVAVSAITGKKGNDTEH